MGISEEISFCGNLDFLSVPPGGDQAPEHEPEPTVDEDYSDEEMDIDELERRMWRDRMLLRRLKEQTKTKEGADSAKQRQSQEQARRKKRTPKHDKKKELTVLSSVNPRNKPGGRRGRQNMIKRRS